MMKKSLFQSAIVLLLIFGCFSLPSQALAKSTGSVVRGNVYDENNGGKGISGLTVTVTCTGKNNETSTKTAITDTNGLYIIKFKKEDCEKFKPVTSSVTDNGQTQTETVSVSSVYTATLDFYFGSVSVPEFSGMTALIALIGSTGLYVLAKKKRLSW